MTRALLVLVTLASTAAVTPAAVAHPTYDYRGGCVLAAVNDETPDGQLGGPNQWTGVAGAVVVATREEGVRPAPTAQLDVTCEFRVNGVPHGPIYQGSGTGVVVGLGPFGYTGQNEDVVTLCSTVTVEGDTHWHCENNVRTHVVPPPVIDAVDLARDIGDPIGCYATGALAPGVPGLLEVSPEGDVFVGGSRTPTYDCPPREEQSANLMRTLISSGGL